MTCMGRVGVSDPLRWSLVSWAEVFSQSCSSPVMFCCLTTWKNTIPNAVLIYSLDLQCCISNIQTWSETAEYRLQHMPWKCCTFPYVKL